MRNVIYIEEAKYIDDYNVLLRFRDGIERVINFGTFLKTRPHPQHNKYIKYSNFKKFHLENGNIVWGKNSDLIFDNWNLYKGKNPL